MVRLGRETEIIVESLENLISGDLLEMKINKSGLAIENIEFINFLEKFIFKLSRLCFAVVLINIFNIVFESYA